MVVLDMCCSSIIEFIKANGGRICLILRYIDYCRCCNLRYITYHTGKRKQARSELQVAENSAWAPAILDNIESSTPVLRIIRKGVMLSGVAPLAWR
jgi:hypothetical protein